MTQNSGYRSNPAQNFEVRCPLHGSIGFNPREREVINHPLTQRLRFISQLGFAELVYPGATHTRFSHGLGVMHLAGRIFDTIWSGSGEQLGRCFTPQEGAHHRQVLRFAGLLHDAGHLPFSHSFEKLFPPLKDIPAPGEWYADYRPQAQARHEDYSVAAVYAMSQGMNPVLSLEEAQDVACLIHPAIIPSARLTGGSPERNLYPLLRQIISGEIDADRMDYLRRDAYFTGVPYGLFDQDRLIQGLSASLAPQGWVMALHHNSLYTFENFLLSRLHMSMQVYFHKTLLPFDYFLEQAVREKEISLPMAGGIDALMESREDILSAKLFQARHLPWSGRIVNRQPYRLLIQFDQRHPEELRLQAVEALTQQKVPHQRLTETRRLSSLAEGAGDGAAAILVMEPLLGRTTFRPLAESSPLLQRYNHLFVVDNLYCEHPYSEAGRRALAPLFKG